MIKPVGDHLWQRGTNCGGVSCPGGTSCSAASSPGGPSMVAATGPGGPILGGPVVARQHPANHLLISVRSFQLQQLWIQFG